MDRIYFGNKLNASQSIVTAFSNMSSKYFLTVNFTFFLQR